MSGINKSNENWHSMKTVIVYLCLSIIAFAIDKIYAVFGHGVHSSAMTWMFLYPLIGGALVYFLMGKLIPGFRRKKGYRLFYNLYNSGIAILTVAAFLKGILDIAGTSSHYVIFFNMIGWLVLALSPLIPIISKLIHF